MHKTLGKGLGFLIRYNGIMHIKSGFFVLQACNSHFFCIFVLAEP